MSREEIGRSMVHQFIRHGDTPGQCRNVSRAHSTDRSVWQLVQGFGILNGSVNVGLMNRNVWLRTLTSAIVCSIRGMLHAFTARTAGAMMGVLLECGTPRSIR